MFKKFKFNLSDKHKKLLSKLTYALIIGYLVYGVYDFATGLKINFPIVVLVIWGLFHYGGAQSKKAAGAVSGAVVKGFSSKVVENLNKNLAIGNEPRLKLSNLESNSLEKVLTDGLKGMIEKEVKERLYNFFVTGVIALALALTVLMLLQVIPPLAGLVTPPAINACPPN